MNAHDTSDHEGMAGSIGALLRQRRKDLGLSLQTVADQAGLSVGFISQIERGLSVPSLSSLTTVSAALDLPLSALIGAAETGAEKTDSRARKTYSIGDDTRAYERLSTTFDGSVLHSLIVHEPPGRCSETVSHAGEEMLFMLSGELTVTIEDETHVLTQGDSLHFNSRRMHSTSNHSSSTAAFIWCGTMDVFGDRSVPDHFGAQDARDRMLASAS